MSSLTCTKGYPLQNRGPYQRGLGMETSLHLIHFGLATSVGKYLLQPQETKSLFLKNMAFVRGHEMAGSALQGCS